MDFTPPHHLPPLKNFQYGINMCIPFIVFFYYIQIHAEVNYL